jgi:hypothetical protein
MHPILTCSLPPPPPHPASSFVYVTAGFSLFFSLLLLAAAWVALRQPANSPASYLTSINASLALFGTFWWMVCAITISRECKPTLLVHVLRCSYGCQGRTCRLLGSTTLQTCCAGGKPPWPTSHAAFVFPHPRPCSARPAGAGCRPAGHHLPQCSHWPDLDPVCALPGGGSGSHLRQVG